jgi:hypothetical protein
VRRELLAGLLLAVAVTVPAVAQEPAPEAAPQRLRPRSGIWMDAGVGYGRLRLTCDGCTIKGINGTTFTVTVGGSPSRYVHLGVEGQIWTGTADDRHEQVRGINLVGQWYPWGRSNGFFLRGGTGLVDGVIAPITDSATVRGLGVGISLSLGYDLAIGRHFSLTVQAGDQLAAMGDLQVNGVPADDTIGYVSRLSVAFTIR